MRIICPNCSAQYEIDASLLPKDGREVQCSACNHVWFHCPDVTASTPRRPASPHPRKSAVAAPACAYPDEEDTAIDTSERPVGHGKPARELDPGVLDILRDEADFEARARAAESLESQPELGLSARSQWPSSATVAPLKSSDAAADTQPAPDGRGTTSRPSAASAALPDIATIDPTFDAADEAPTAPTGMEQQARNSSFGRGFAIPVVLALLLIAVYLAAPGIMRALPSTDAPLASYVDAVDGLRIRVASLLGG